MGLSRLLMEQDKIISTRGLKPDAVKYGELVFDVNSAYFYNHGGYEFAKQFYADAYKAAVEIVGGEQYIPVSYTHLDVYKRQVLCLSGCRSVGKCGAACPPVHSRRSIWCCLLYTSRCV